MLVIHLRIDPCDARPFCSDLIKLEYLFRTKVYLSLSYIII